MQKPSRFLDFSSSLGLNAEEIFGCEPVLGGTSPSRCASLFILVVFGCMLIETAVGNFSSRPDSHESRGNPGLTFLHPT